MDELFVYLPTFTCQSSKLNPDAAEFVPRFGVITTPAKKEDAL